MTQADDTAKPKLSLLIARRIEDEIVALGWPVGEVIAFERELMERFEVSRAALREAIRIVEFTGAAYMRRGPGGGLMVAEPRMEAVATAAGVYFASLGVTVQQIHDAWHPLVEHCVVLATLRSDAEGARRVVAHMDAMAAHRRLGADDFVELSGEIVALAGNPLLTLFAAAIGEVGARKLRGTSARAHPPLTLDDALRQLQDYRRLVEAIAAHDETEARTRIGAINRALGRQLQEPATQPRTRPTVVEPNGTLAKRIAGLMCDDIERAGWKAGTLLGSEAELIDRYNVSRSVLREALRILELQGAVATRRGPGGGIFVTQPDSSGIVHAARVVMQFQGVNGSDIWEAREAVEEVCIRLVTERLDDEAADTLQRALDFEDRSDEWAITEHVVHRALAEATGNPPMVLFIEALAELSTADVRSALRGKQRPAFAMNDIHRAHELIVEAILAGDADKAAARMRRHLRAAASSYSPRAAL